MRIKYIGKQPKMVNGIWMHESDVRDLSDKQALSLAQQNPALFVLIGAAPAPKVEAQPIELPAAPLEVIPPAELKLLKRVRGKKK